MISFSRKIILSLLLCGAISAESPAIAQDSVKSRGPIRFSPAFRSVQIDGAIIVFSACGGASVDFDLFVPSVESRAMTVGARFGPDWTGWSGAGGGGGERMDYNLYMRTSVGGRVARFDVLLGYSWEGTTATPSSPADNLFKAGAEVRWKLLTNGTGLLFKVNGSRAGGFVGVGLFLGYDAN